MIFLVLTVWLAALLAASAATMHLWAAVCGGRAFRWFVAPGVIAHECSHWAACLLTGTKVFEVRFFEPRGGYVRHAKPRFAPFGVLISFAPVFGCLGALWGVTVLLDDPLGLLATPGGAALTFDPEVEPSAVRPEPVEGRTGAGGARTHAESRPDGPEPGAWVRGAGGDDLPMALGRLAGDVAAAVPAALEALRRAPGRWQAWLWLYAAAALTIALAPSKQDFKNCAVGVVLCVLAAVVVWYLGGATVDAWSRGLLAGVLGLLRVSLAVAVVSLALSLAARGAVLVLRRR